MPVVKAYCPIRRGPFAPIILATFQQTHIAVLICSLSVPGIIPISVHANDHDQMIKEVVFAILPYLSCFGMRS